MIRAFTILFALALLWATVVAVLFVGYADLPDPGLRCVPETLDRLEQTPIKLYHSRRRRSSLCIRQI
jgi:hypothetical protein